MARLTRDDWIEAALLAIEAGGVAAVAVEPLAAGLGATKGSFYWHFGSRDDLVAAALADWERRRTQDVIDEVEATTGDPARRLRLLFDVVFAPHDLGGVDVALFSARDDPSVREALQRVTATRIRYIARLLRECGLPAAAARRRAVLAYSAFVGHAHLVRADPDLVARSVGSLRRYGDEVVAALVGSVVVG